MQTPLIVTKLQPPRPRPGRAARARLIDRLRESAAYPVTLISAPAGYGKTTLAAEWTAVCGLPVAWLTLEVGDNDLARFMAYLIGALQTADAAVGQSTRAALAAQPLPPPPALLAPLLNELNARSEPVCLVLDDYHLIEAPAIHAAVTFLIDHQPPQLRLLLLTRADPPLPIARLRARGQLCEVRQTDLRFTEEEAADLLREIARLKLPADELAALTGRTEGWAAGLQMAAATLRGRRGAQIAEFIRAFSGANRHVLDYLVEEVLRQQPEAVQAFLVRTSILARLTGPLCDALIEPEAGGQPATALLHELERANLFITALDDRREWYRYHPLFAELLRHRLHAAEAERVPELHRRACAWLADQGALTDAIPHALAAGDTEAAAALMERLAPDAWKRGEIFNWTAWSRALPEAALRARPQLGLYATLIHLIDGRSLAEVAARLQAIDAQPLPAPVRGQSTVMRAVMATLQGDFALSRALAEQALHELPADDVFHGLAVRTLSGISLLTGDFGEVERLLEADVRLCGATGDQLGASASLRRLGSVNYLRGRLRRAWAYYQEALRASVDARGQPWPTAGRVLVHLAEIAYDRGDLTDAVGYAQESNALLAEVFPTWALNGHLLLARAWHAQGDGAAADQAMAEARRLARDSDTRLDDVLVAVHQARLWLRQGRVDAAARWAAEARPAAGGPATAADRNLENLVASTYLRELTQTTHARLALGAGDPAQALEHLAPALAKAESQERVGSLIEIQVLRALAFQALGDMAPARAALAQALRQAEPEGFTRVFFDEGNAMRALLQSEPGQPYARALLARLAGPAAPEAPAASPLVEPLSEREQEVLALIAAGLSNQQIADQLVLSLYTIKFHTYNLYGKLGVHTRTQAVARARALGLLTFS